MSVINKVLRELDQRHAIAATANEGGPREVRPVRDPNLGHEWFWRVVAALLVASLAWVGWVIYQVQPRRVATDLGIAAGESARRDPPRIVAEKKPAAAPEAAATPASATEPAGGLKLAQSIQTPIAETGPEPAKVAAVIPEKAAAPDRSRSTTSSVPPRPKPSQHAASAPRVEKHELIPAPAQRAQGEFRRGTAFLQQGRVSEAEARFDAAIALDPRHEQARQALAAMLIEQRRLDDASNLLQTGLAVNPRQQQFAIALARIDMERADYASALEVLNRSREGALPSAESDAALGSVLSRLGRDREAVDAYRSALRAAPDKGGTWLGLALSLENLGRRVDAADAYRRALATGALTADVKQYAEQKVRQLR
jgi:MSHA biogenesis protein MshN